MKIELTDKEVEYLARLLELNYADRPEDFPSDHDLGTPNPSYNSLFSKLMHAAHKTFQSTWREVRKERFSLKENCFETKRLFLGAGYHTSFQIAQLHKRLAFAASELGGEQQNGGMGTEYDEQSGKEAKENIKSVLRDIIHAFDYKPEDL